MFIYRTINYQMEWLEITFVYCNEIENLQYVQVSFFVLQRCKNY